MKALSIIFLLFNFAFAITVLEGDISGQKFTKNNSPYLVKKDIKVSGDIPTIIEKDCLFLFTSFTSLKVSGNLHVKGTIKAPVIFTSVNNILFSDESIEIDQKDAFDWNGIIVEEKAKKIILDNFELSNSIFGLKSSTSKIIVHQGIFKNNGDFNFIIKDEILKVKEGIPYDYGILPVTLKKNGDIGKVIRISSFSTSVAVLSTMGWSLYKANKYQEKYEKAKHPIQMSEYKKNKETCIKEATNLGIIGAAFFSIGMSTLLFQRDKDISTNISFYITPQKIFFSLSKDI